MKMVRRVQAQESAINDAIVLWWEDGWELIDISFPAGMIWAMLVFERREDVA
jgi:hypothetical protein